MKYADNIIQLLPADGWHALIGLIDIEKARQKIISFEHVDFPPLVAWALVENDGRRFVTGMIVDDDANEVVALVGRRISTGLIGYYKSMPDKETIRDELEFLQELYDENHA